MGHVTQVLKSGESLSTPFLRAEMRPDFEINKHTAHAKATALRKVLQQDEFCKATEASWAKHSSEVQSLDVLTRCKKLNEFLKQVCADYYAPGGLSIAAVVQVAATCTQAPVCTGQLLLSTI